MKKVKIVFPSRTGRSQSRTIELLDTHCIENKKSFSASSAEPLFTSIVLSPATMIENGEVMFSKSWRVTDPTPRERKPAEDKDDEKKLILSFIAKSDDIKGGKFGFDKFDEDFKKIYDGTDFTTFENEYNPIQVYGEKYFPIWVSMRKGQTITLDLEQIKLGKVKTKNYDLYDEIKFEDHPDFTFAPVNLKDAKEVRITCNNTNAATAQIKLEADDETVGAINFFYRAPKVVDLRWVVVNFNEGDEKITKGKVSRTNLIEYFRTAFNPALIDIRIINNEAELLDYRLPITPVNSAQKAYVERIKTNLVLDSKDTIKQTEANKINFITSLNTLHQLRQNRLQGPEITLYLTNLKSGSSIKSPTDSDNTIDSYNNGITVGTMSMMFLKNTKQNPDVEIPHEVMHALGLPHSFKVEGRTQKHIFKLKTTKNYMDYSNEKIYTWKWQWELLH